MSKKIQVCWLPFVKLIFQEPFRIGKAEVYLDTEENWIRITGLSRPEHLKIFKETPFRNTEAGNISYGTFIYSTESEWLSLHSDSVVSILYFMGTGQNNYPADMFYYQLFTFTEKSDAKGTLVGYYTKKSNLIEGPDSLAIYPPLGARGFDKKYMIPESCPMNNKLLQLFLEQPEHRLIIAIRHYFRAQFNEPFHSPLDQDTALYSGAIEAALDIDGRLPEMSRRFVEAMTEIFGESDEKETFFLGFYAARSLFIHGASTNIEPSRDCFITMPA